MSFDLYSGFLVQASGKIPDSVTAQMLEETYPGIAGTEECQKWVTGSICECSQSLVT